MIDVLRQCWAFQKGNPLLALPEGLIAFGYFIVGLNGGHHPLVAALLSLTIAAAFPLFGGIQASIDKWEADAAALSRAERATRDGRADQ